MSWPYCCSSGHGVSGRCTQSANDWWSWRKGSNFLSHSLLYLSHIETFREKLAIDVAGERRTTSLKSAYCLPWSLFKSYLRLFALLLWYAVCIAGEFLCRWWSGKLEERTLWGLKGTSYFTRQPLHGTLLFSFNWSSLHTAFKQKGELPPGRSPVATNSAFPFQDSEIEKELNELRRKAKEF